MRKTVVAALLLSLATLSGCTTIRRVGTTVCDAQERVSRGISNVGEFFGGPGNLVAGSLNIVLEAGCKLFDVAFSAPVQTAEDLGLTGGGSDDAGVDAAAGPGSPGQ